MEILALVVGVLVIGGALLEVISDYVRNADFGTTLTALFGMMHDASGASLGPLPGWIITAVFVGYGVVFAVKNYIVVLAANVISKSKKRGIHV